MEKKFYAVRRIYATVINYDEGFDCIVWDWIIEERSE